MRPDVAIKATSPRGGGIDIATLPSPAAWVDANGIVEAHNAAMSDFFDVESGRPFSDALRPEDVGAFDLALKRLTLGAPAASVEIQATGDRKASFIASLAKPQSDDASQVILLQLIDISSLRQSFDALAERESRWNHALVGSASGVWDQRNSGEMYYSEVWRSIRGLGPDDPIAQNMEEWLELVHPQDRERVLHSIERQNEGDPDYTTFQYREMHKDGHYVWIECRGACVERDENGQPARIVGTDTDVTARKAQEEWLEGLSRRLKLAVDISRIGIFETDFDAGISEWDERMREIFEVPFDEDVRVGDFWERKLHPDDREQTLAHVEKRIAALKPFTDNYRITASDGSTRYIRANSLPYVDNDGHLKMIGVNWDVTEDQRLRQELECQKALAEARNAELDQIRIDAEYSALHDYLTALPNRRYLESRLDELRKTSSERKRGIAVLHIDLDRFKQINDTLGHGAGDAMLKHAARILRDNIRPTDFAARIGGDEFVVLLDYDGNDEVLSTIADRIIGEMRQPVWHNGQECRFGASIGIAYSEDRSADPRALLQNADIALYNAKNQGRNRHEFYTQSSRRLLADARRLSSELLRALENDEIIPFYQLQFDAKTRQITGAECLARWRHPTQGILGPDRFLAAADECGVLAQIDGIILEKALADVAVWRQEGLHLPKISVNVSARRLKDPNLASGLAALDIKPGTVSFELLESVFLDRQDAAVMANLETLRQLSIDIEIDDFGTGHASIVGLLNLKPSTLKIDRQLIENIPTSQEQRILVMSIIQIARSLKIKVTAEGVETEEHARILKRLGCDVLQGYGLARPLDVTATGDLLRAHKKAAAT
ncbi:EAL domain-containing protein [Rhizobium sp. WL3]|uniref:sensor domain-containing protein n=1 Tax=Rhizobium sp. WL3 TaxID=2603277 RepID=UPI0011C1EFE2|nr:EAL domain-containing protein [Rhizobium sp. WL3]QEE44058.1 EAL domain-containing protein [Rhizobium sp. WL3]